MHFTYKSENGGVFYFMKVIAKPIEMICWFDKDGVHPIRFRLQEQDEKNIVIKVDKVITKTMERLAGNNMLVFECQSIINGRERRYQIKYELATCRWILFKA